MNMKKKLTALVLALMMLLPASCALAKEQYTKREATISGELNLNINDRFVDIKVKSGSGSEIYVQMMENEHYTYTIEEKDGEAFIVCNDESTWLDKFFNNLKRDDRTLTITLPKSYAKNITVNCKFSDFEAENISAKDLNADMEFSDGDFENVSLAGGIAVKAQFGGVDIESFTAQALAVDGAYSDIEIKDCEIAQGAAVVTEYGDFEAESFSFGEKFILKGQYANLKFKKITFGEKMEISSDFGDITGRLPGSKSDYTIATETSFGDCNLPKESTGGDKQLTITSSFSDVSISFGN